MSGVVDRIVGRDDWRVPLRPSSSPWMPPGPRPEIARTWLVAVGPQLLRAADAGTLPVSVRTRPVAGRRSR